MTYGIFSVDYDGSDPRELHAVEAIEGEETEIIRLDEYSHTDDLDTDEETTVYLGLAFPIVGGGIALVDEVWYDLRDRTWTTDRVGEIDLDEIQL